MRKAVLLFLSVMMVSVLSGCGGQKDSQAEQGGGESRYAEALDVLNEVIKVYGEDELFSMYGGDQENAVMDGPGKFDIAKTEELESVYGLAADQSSNIEDAATMVHLMNANTFTGAVYRIKEGVDMNAFADALKSCILARQWICGYAGAHQCGRQVYHNRFWGGWDNREFQNKCIVCAQWRPGDHRSACRVRPLCCFQVFLFCTIFCL